MWNDISNIASTAASMLQSGKAPPNTPPEDIDSLKATNFLKSKKFFVVVTAFVALLAFFAVGVFILFLTAPLPGITVPFVTIFTKTTEILAFIITVYLGAQATLDFKYGSNSNVDLNGVNSVVSEQVDQKIVEQYAEKYSNDNTYAPLKWVEEQPHE